MLVTGFSKPNKTPFLLGIAGGSGSGKTFFARHVQQALGKKLCDIIYQDNFYFDQSENFDFDGGSVNFDHPNSIDFELLTEKLLLLKQGMAVEIPIYDFVTHKRKQQTIHVDPKPIIIIDGILIFYYKKLLQIFDDTIFCDTPEELRFQRRLERDVKERGRTPQGVKDQFYKQVKPMHDKFVEPSKQNAKIIVKDVDDYIDVLNEYCAKLKRIL